MRSEREARWRELAGLLDRLDRGGLGSLSTREVKRMASLYRQVTIDLSHARARGDDPARVHYLNGLAARAHGRVYAARPVDLRPMFSFLTVGFAQLLRKHWRYVAAAAAIFLFSTLISGLAVVHNPELAYSLFDEKAVQYENMRLEKQKGEYRGNFESIEGTISPVAAAIIIANNCRVALLAFAFGALYCLPGMMLLIYNGRMLGTLSGLVYNGGYFVGFYSLIMTHGVLELSAIVISAAAGLMLGWAVASPGRLPRRDALRAVSREALGLLCGSFAMLFIAGLIEAFVTPHFDATVRWSVAGASAVLFGWYVLLAGRFKSRRAERSPNSDSRAAV